MKEFMMYIRNDGSSLSAAQELEFIKRCEVYIEALKKRDQLISAQPIGDDCRVLSRPSGTWREEACTGGAERHAGYYHIRAKDMDEAMMIARDNPEFAYRPTARIEVRSIKTGEDSTGYVYPTGAKA